MIEDIRKSYLQLAQNINGWETANKNDLINKYIDIKDTDPIQRDWYFSAIILRYWNNVYKYYSLSSKTIELEECAGMLAEGVKYIIDTPNIYNKWRTDKNSKYYNNKNAPDIFMNMGLYSTRQYFYQYSNVDKRKGFFSAVSIESQLEAVGDGAEFLDNAECEAVNYSKANELNDFIKKFFTSGKPVKAFILDGICYQDSFKENKKKIVNEYTDENGRDTKDVGFSYSYEFNERKLVDQLDAINSDYINYFKDKYSITDNDFTSALTDLKKMNRADLHWAIKKLMIELKSNKELLAIIC